MTGTDALAFTLAANATVSWDDKSTANASASAPSICFFTSTSDGNGDLVSPETELFIAKLKSAVVIPLLFFIGAPCQFLNIVVFFKQGLQDRVNLCLFSLAIVDFAALCSSFLLFSEHMFMFRSHETIGPAFKFFVNNKLLLFYSCTYGSVLLHMIIALDRCCCVLFPFRSKTLLKTKNVAIFIVIGVPLVCFLRLVVLAKYVIVCFFDTRRQLTFLALYVTEYEARNKVLLDLIDGVFYGVVIAMVCPIVISIATLVTSVKLWRTLAWRKQTSSADIKKELAGTKMLILLSLEFLVFASPVVFMKLFPLISAEFSVKGRYRLFFLASTNVAEMCFSLRLSFSSVVYYVASSRFRRTLSSLLIKKDRCCGGFHTKRLDKNSKRRTKTVPQTAITEEILKTN